MNPGNNAHGQQTITAAQINSYLGASYAFSYIKGVQDPGTNPGGAFSQAAIALSDGLLLLKTGGTGSVAVTLEGSWDSGVASGVTSQAVVRDFAVSAGDLLLVCVIGNQDDNVTSVTDGQFGSLTTYSNSKNWDGGNSNWMQLFWGVAGQSNSASGSNTVTAEFSSSTSKAEVIVAQFRCSSGYIFEPSPLGAAVTDGPQAEPGTGTGAIGSGNTNFGYQPMLAFAACFDETGSGGQTLATSGWSSGFEASSGKFVPAWAVITATGNQGASWTASSSGGSDTYQAMLVGLKIASAALTATLEGSWDSGVASGVTSQSVVAILR